VVPAQEVDCQELAANAFSTAVDMDSNNEGAKHMLASVTADATMKRASNSYVEELFEGYAENFEHSLVEDLKYDGFQRLRRAFNEAFDGEGEIGVPSFELVIDAGCGTGLVGEQFRNISHTLVGVDLSAAIIHEAQKKRPNLYDETHVGDIVEIFQQRSNKVSLIVAADSFIYFGDLDPLFESMANSLTGDGSGYVAFTVENVARESEEM
jgi:predicted TPR repeat methyltransferase